MTSRSRFPRAAFLVPSMLAALLVVPLTGAAAQAEPGDPTGPGSAARPVPGPLPALVDPATVIDPVLGTVGAGDAGDPQAEAEAALETAQGILDATTPVTAGESNDLTLALADVAATQENLPPRLQDQAAQLLARPNKDAYPNGIECQKNSGLPCYTSAEAAPVCAGTMCVHYVTADAKNRSTQAWATKVLGVMQTIATTYVDAGYRKPVSDGTVGGGNGVFDVYLADLGPYGLYGYCTTDRRVSGHGTAAAYCVLDNDYSPDQYPGPTNADGILKATAAHEYFHAVQFAYDIGEDRWMMEATATWAEDEVFTEVNDNRQYLRSGPLGRPAQPLTATGNGLAPYGAWIFFRFLSERYPTESGGMPVIVREIWERSVGATASRAAINRTLAARGTELRKQFGLFTAWNRRPAAYYSEGSAYRAAPLWRRYRLTMGRSVSARTDIKKTASRTVRYKSALQRAGRLRVDVDLPVRSSGAYAIVTIKKKNKAPVTTKIKINAQGNKRAVYPFGRKVQWVEINLSNSGTKTRTAKISARVIR